MKIRENARLICGIVVVAFGLYDLVVWHSYVWGSIVEVGGLLIVAGAVFEKSRGTATTQSRSGE